jgi:hypothetical protein
MSELEPPKIFRYITTFIDRVGFPILAFLIMAYICFVSLEGMKKSLNENTSVIKELKTIISLKIG